jgi:hypothetical protein
MQSNIFIKVAELRLKVGRTLAGAILWLKNLDVEGGSWWQYSWALAGSGSPALGTPTFDRPHLRPRRCHGEKVRVAPAASGRGVHPDPDREMRLHFF